MTYNIGGIPVTSIQNVSLSGTKELNEHNLLDESNNFILSGSRSAYEIEIEATLIQSLHPSSDSVESQRKAVKSLVEQEWRENTFTFSLYDGFISIEEVSVPEESESTTVRNITITGRYLPSPKHQPAVTLSGFGEGVGTGSAVLSNINPLVASGSGNGTGTAALSVIDIEGLVASGVGTGTGTATLSRRVGLVGSGQGVGTGTGDVTVIENSLTVTATLNSDSATLVMLEDANGDGVYENEQEYILLDGTNTYPLDNFDLSGGNTVDFEVRSDKTGVESAGVEIESITLDY